MEIKHRYTDCADHTDRHEFSAVILIDTNGSEIKIIQQSLWLLTKVSSEKAKEQLYR